jgi:hypothetical protein
VWWGFVAAGLTCGSPCDASAQSIIDMRTARQAHCLVQAMFCFSPYHSNMCSYTLKLCGCISSMAALLSRHLVSGTTMVKYNFTMG